MTASTEAPNAPPTCCMMRVALLACGTWPGSRPSKAAAMTAMVAPPRPAPRTTSAALNRISLVWAVAQGERQGAERGDEGAGQYDRAADHLAALTFGQINNRTLFGLVQLTDNELDTIVVGGVGVFVRAYRRAG